MPIYPTLVKTWQYNVNQALVANGSQPTDAQKLMFALVTSFTSSPGWVNSWTILESSNSVAVAGAGGNWASFANLIWANAGTAHSWIVLEQTGVTGTFQVLIDLNSTNTFFATITMSPSAGFTGGTTTAAPTAVDGVPLFAGPGAWGVDSSVSIQYKLHVMQSTDGACTRAFICRYSNSSAGGVVSGYIAFEVPQNPVTGWVNPVVGLWLGASGATQELSYTNLYNNANTVGRGVSNMTLVWTGETGTGNRVLIADAFYAPNSFNGGLVLHPVGLYSATASNRGRHGWFFDLWWGPGQFQNSPNIQFPAAANYDFAQFGVIVVPWNGTTCQMT